jgi:hypothetical protein
MSAGKCKSGGGPPQSKEPNGSGKFRQLQAAGKIAKNIDK